MNYIYDILLNFKKTFYEFYDWNIEDDIIHIRKIPAFKVSSKSFIDIKKGIIKVDDFFLNSLLSKTEQIKKEGTTKLKYACLFSDGKDTLAVEFKKNGITNLKSSLTIDENDDITNIIKFWKETNLKYTFLKTEYNNEFKTRFEKEYDKHLIKELNTIYKQKEYDKLNYICLECLGKTERNPFLSLKKIKKEITKGNDNFYKLFDFFNLSSKK